MHQSERLKRAAKAQMIFFEKDFPKEKKKPNKTTLQAMRESKEGNGFHCESIEDFWDKMGMNPHA